MDNVTELSKGLADTMLRAAEELVAKAQMTLDQTKAFVEIINNQVAAHAKQNADMVERFKEAGASMLDAHRILNGEGTAGQPVGSEKIPDRTLGGNNDERYAAPVSPIDRLRALDDIRHGRNGEAGTGTGGVDYAPRNVYGTGHPARPGGLSPSVADAFRVVRERVGEDRHDQTAGPARS